MTDAICFNPMTRDSAERLGIELAAIDPWAHYRYTAAALSTYFSAHEEGAPRFEILVGDRLAGAICIRQNWLRGPYLQLLAVLPAFQKQGIGGLALTWFEAWAKSTNVENIWVVASAFNFRAIAFYERFGFVRVATLDGLVSKDEAEILFRKRLPIG